MLCYFVIMLFAGFGNIGGAAVIRQDDLMFLAVVVV